MGHDIDHLILRAYAVMPPPVREEPAIIPLLRIGRNRKIIEQSRLLEHNQILPGAVLRRIGSAVGLVAHLVNDVILEYELDPRTVARLYRPAIPKYALKRRIAAMRRRGMRGSGVAVNVAESRTVDDDAQLVIPLLTKPAQKGSMIVPINQTGGIRKRYACLLSFCRFFCHFFSYRDRSSDFPLA